MENKLRNILLGGLALTLIACAGNSQPRRETSQRPSNRELHLSESVRHEAQIREKIDNAYGYTPSGRIQLTCSIAHNRAYGNASVADRKSADECYNDQIRR